MGRRKRNKNRTGQEIVLVKNVQGRASTPKNRNVRATANRQGNRGWYVEGQGSLNAGFSYGKKPTGRRIPVRVTPVPIANDFVVESRMPDVVSSQQGTRVRHHELVVEDVAGTVSYGVVDFAINPGLGFFSWLSQTAVAYEKYRWHKLRFFYVPTAAVTTTAGSVSLALDFDPERANPATYEGYSNFEVCETGKPFEIVSVDLVQKLVQKDKFLVRCGNMAQGRLLYDAVKLLVGTLGEADTSVIGQVWCEYDIEFFSPLVEVLTQRPKTVSVFANAAGTAFVSGANTGIAYGTLVVNSLGITMSFGTFTVPCGCYLVYADGVFNDTVAEGQFLQMFLTVNGVGVAPNDVRSETNVTAIGAGQKTFLSLMGYITLNDTGTVVVYGNISGAAGVLSEIGLGKLIFQCV